MALFGNATSHRHASREKAMQLASRNLPFIILTAGLLVSAGNVSVLAAEYPSRPIRLVVPFPPGGAADPVARTIAQALGARLGQPVVIINKGGAGGSLAMDEVARSLPDGYTLLLAHSGMTYMPGLYRKLPFDPVKSFDVIVDAVSGFYMLAVNPSVPVKSVAELVAYARANPGKLTYGSAGVGSTLHLAGEMFKRSANIDIVHVPYKGAGPAITDLAGGQTSMMFGPAVSILPLAEAGKLRVLAVTSANRWPQMSDLPAMAETLPGFEIVGWYGLAAPAGTPRSEIAKLNSETNLALQSSGFVAHLRQLTYEPLGGTPDEAAARMKAEVVRWTKIIKDADIEAR
jgi:tripartite-type tricarboxylate transporter receptor subunit TctC